MTASLAPIAGAIAILLALVICTVIAGWTATRGYVEEERDPHSDREGEQ